MSGLAIDSLLMVSKPYKSNDMFSLGAKAALRHVVEVLQVKRPMGSENLIRSFRFRVIQYEHQPKILHTAQLQ